MENNKEDEKLNKAEPAQNTESAELEKMQKERDEYLNGWKRAKADLMNYQRDESKRLQDAARFGSEMVMRDLILVLDSFELGLRSMEKNGGADKGVYIIKSQLEDVLKRQGLEKMKVSPGDKFDPNFHESLGEMESDKEPGTVAVEIEAGYLLSGKVVRPARVKLVS